MYVTFWAHLAGFKITHNSDQFHGYHFTWHKWKIYTTDLSRVKRHGNGFKFRPAYGACINWKSILVDELRSEQRWHGRCYNGAAWLHKCCHLVISHRGRVRNIDTGTHKSNRARKWISSPRTAKSRARIELPSTNHDLTRLADLFLVRGMKGLTLHAGSCSRGSVRPSLGLPTWEDRARHFPWAMWPHSFRREGWKMDPYLRAIPSAASLSPCTLNCLILH